MDALGRHVLLDYFDCDVRILKDAERLKEIMTKAAEKMEASIRYVSPFINFDEYGVSGVIIIAESHLSIHTWPEYGYAAVDFFTCGNTIDPWNAYDFLKTELQAGSTSQNEFKRGIFADRPAGSLSHKPT